MSVSTQIYVQVCTVCLVTNKSERFCFYTKSGAEWFSVVPLCSSTNATFTVESKEKAFLRPNNKVQVSEPAGELPHKPHGILETSSKVKGHADSRKDRLCEHNGGLGMFWVRVATRNMRLCFLLKGQVSSNKGQQILQSYSVFKTKQIQQQQKNKQTMNKRARQTFPEYYLTARSF